MIRLAGPVVLITAVASRIGRATATHLAQNGARLLIHYRDAFKFGIHGNPAA